MEEKTECKNQKEVKVKKKGWQIMIDSFHEAIADPTSKRKVMMAINQAICRAYDNLPESKNAEIVSLAVEVFNLKSREFWISPVVEFLKSQAGEEKLNEIVAAQGMILEPCSCGCEGIIAITPAEKMLESDLMQLFTGGRNSRSIFDLTS